MRHGIAVERRVNAIFCDQFRAGSVLGDSAVFEHHDPAQPVDRRQSVRHNQRRAAAHQFENRSHDRALGAWVEGAGWFVEQEDWRVFEKRPGDADALALADAQVPAALAHRAIESLRHFADEIERLRLPCGLDDFGLGRAGFSVSDVFADGRGKEQRVLKNHADLRAQAFLF